MMIVPITPPIATFAPMVRTLSTIGSTKKVTGWDGKAAPGRTVLVLGKNQWGLWEVKVEGRTDSNGDFVAHVNSGPNDRFVVVAIGDEAHAEHTRALGNLTGGL